MNVELKMSAMCVGKKRQLGSDGKTEFYSIAIVQNGEAGSLSCNVDVYNQAEELKMYDFTCVYRDGQYKGLRVTHAGVAGSSGYGSADPQSTAAEKGKK